MNKIPKCKSKNAISRQHLKLTKKYSGENKLINIQNSKILKHFDSSKYFTKNTKNIKNSLISSSKPSVFTTASSKNNSVISNQNVIKYILYIILF